MIEKSEVDEAFAAATLFLDEKSELAGIRKSKLLTKAYFLGLISGLEGIASEKDLHDNILVPYFQKTMMPRITDDSFQSTLTGKLFDSLRQKLLREEVDRPAILAAVQSLANHVDALDSKWKAEVGHTRMLLKVASESGHPADRGEQTEETVKQRHSKRDEIHKHEELARLEGSRLVDFANHLECVARRIALVEADPRIWDRMQE